MTGRSSLIRNFRSISVKPSLNRTELIKAFGKNFNVNSLPDDFDRARPEGIVKDNKFMVVGEYGKNSGRIALITCNSCVINDHYRHVSGVRHIHSIIRYEPSNAFLISTDDISKLLDLWIINDGKLSFVKTIKKRMAGYTACTKVNGKYYFGTDFSEHPNYIETLEGKRYFFPAKAYTKYVMAFYSLLDRYIISINTQKYELGARKALSIFDTEKENFCFVTIWTAFEENN